MADIRSIVFEGVRLATLSDTVNDPAGPFAGFYTLDGLAVYYKALDGSVALAKPAASVVFPMVVQRIFTSSTVSSTVYGVIAQPYRTRPST